MGENIGIAEQANFLRGYVNFAQALMVSTSLGAVNSQFNRHEFQLKQNIIVLLYLSTTLGCKSSTLCFIYCMDRSVNKRADNGTTPVYFAAQEGRLECLKFLIAQASLSHHILSLTYYMIALAVFVFSNCYKCCV